jgi:uncharacterized coiled-coil protein SlyX/N-acetylneuraminic acid mutarotase
MAAIKGIPTEGIGNMRMRYELAKTLAFSSIALVMMAGLAASAPIAAAEPYDTGYGLSPLSAPRAYAGAAFGDDELLYVLGGYDGISGYTLSSVLVYDVSTGLTAYGSSMPVGVINAGCVKGLDGRIYVMGGYNTTVVYPLSTQIYNTSTNSWATGANLPRAMYWTTAALGTDGRIFLFGGYDFGSAINSTLIYDPLRNIWTYGADLPTPRWSASAVTLANGSIAVIGGVDGLTAVNTVEVYDPVDDSWYTAEPLGTARRGGASALGMNGHLYYFGGTQSWGLYGNPVYSLIERNVDGSWEASDYSLWYAREGFGTAVDKHGRVFVVGGYSGSDVVPYVEYLIMSEITEQLDLVITSPSEGDVVSGVVAVDVTLKNGAFIWWSPVLTIDFLVDGVWHESQMGASSWTFLWDTAGLPDMSAHTLTVRAFFQDLTVKEDSVTVTVSHLSMEERVAAIEQQLVDLESQLAAQDANLTALSAQVAALQAQLLALQAALVAMGDAQSAAMDDLNATLADLQLQLDAFQEQIDRLESKADTGGTYGVVTMLLVIIVVVLLAVMLVMARKKP